MDSRKFFHATQTKASCFTKTLFLRVSESSKPKIPSEWVWNLKNRHQLTFVFVKSGWGVVRCSRFLSEIDMITTKLANTQGGFWWPLENFFTPLKPKRFFRFHTHSEGIFGFELSEILKKRVFVNMMLWFEWREKILWWPSAPTMCVCKLPCDHIYLWKQTRTSYDVPIGFYKHKRKLLAVFEFSCSLWSTFCM